MNNKHLRFQRIIDCLPRKNEERCLEFESPVSIKESPNFNEEQIKYLRRLIANSPISMFSNTITAMCSEETRQYAYENICAIGDEMIKRKNIKNDNVDEEYDSVFEIGFRFPLK